MATHQTAVHYLGSYCTAALLALGAGNAAASSFALIEQSVSGMGTAYAVGSSGIDDASTVYFNPAGMSRLHGSHLSGGLHIVDLKTDFKGSAEYAKPATPPFGLMAYLLTAKRNSTSTPPNWYPAAISRTSTATRSGLAWASMHRLVLKPITTATSG